MILEPTTVALLERKVCVTRCEIGAVLAASMPSASLDEAESPALASIAVGTRGLGPDWPGGRSVSYIAYTATLSTGQSCGQSTLGWTVHCPLDCPVDSVQDLLSTLIQSSENARFCEIERDMDELSD